MALWDGDGHNDLFDDYIEYLIYKDVTGQNDDESHYVSRSDRYNSSYNSAYVRSAAPSSPPTPELIHERAMKVADSVCIPENEEFNRLREKYSDDEIKEMAAIVVFGSEEARQEFYPHFEHEVHRNIRCGYQVITALTAFFGPVSYLMSLSLGMDPGLLLILVVLIPAASIFFIAKSHSISSKMKKENIFKEEYDELHKALISVKEEDFLEIFRKE